MNVNKKYSVCGEFTLNCRTKLLLRKAVGGGFETSKGLMGALMEKASSPFFTKYDPLIVGKTISGHLSGREMPYQFNILNMGSEAKLLG